jgi:hypothetical protein
VGGEERPQALEPSPSETPDLAEIIHGDEAPFGVAQGDDPVREPWTDARQPRELLGAGSVQIEWSPSIAVSARGRARRGQSGSVWPRDLGFARALRRWRTIAVEPFQALHQLGTRLSPLAYGEAGAGGSEQAEQEYELPAVVQAHAPTMARGGARR